MSNIFAAFSLRLPNQLHEKVKATAKANRRSVNGEIIARLEKTLLPGQLHLNDNKSKEILSEYIETLRVKVEELESELANYKRKRPL